MGMPLTIRSVLEVGKIASPLIGGAIRFLGGKGEKTDRAATIVENTLNRNPKKLTAGLTTGLTITAVAALKIFFPEQANAIIAWLTTNLPQILEALAAAN